MRPLSILLVLSEPPLPFGHAVGRWYYVLLRGLVERGHDVTALVAGGSPKEIAEARNLFPSPTYDVRFYPYSNNRGLASKLKTLCRPFSYSFSSELYDDLRTEHDKGADILHLEGIWTGWLGKDEKSQNSLLNFHSLYDIDQEEQAIQGVSDWLQRRMRRRAESKLLRSYPTLLTLTDRLKEKVHDIAPEASVHVVPLGLDGSLYPFIPAPRRQIEPVISVIGSMDWYPSYSAAVRLLTRLWPEIKKRVPEAKVQIIGWNARSALSHYLSLSDVAIIENVADMKPYFERTSILLYAPGRGSGMKVKVLEAFAYGVPVVTTSEGVEGIPAVDGVHACVSDDDKDLIERAVGLLLDREQQERLRVAARALLESHCGPQATLRALERVYSNMLQEVSQ